MPKKRMFPIDPARMNDALAVRKLTPVQVSKRLGYCDAYIALTMNRRRISEACITALDAVYGIKYAEYRAEAREEPQEEQKAEQQPVSVNVNIDYEELFRCVYLACYKAFQKALKEDSGGESD